MLQRIVQYEQATEFFWPSPVVWGLRAWAKTGACTKSLIQQAVVVFYI